MNLTLIEIIKNTFEKSGDKQLHVDNISSLILQYNFIEESLSKEELAKKVSQALASNVKSKNPLFKKFKNKQGGLKKGIYGLKQTREKKEPLKIPSVSNQYTGKAGEYAVLSELLFNGFNASLMSVDDGIDIVASKDNKYFHIQVKTANESNNSFTATIKRGSYEKYDTGSTYYILVLRKIDKNNIRNEFVVFSSSVINHFITSKIIKDSQNISLKVSVENNVLKLNNNEVITPYVNNFNLIK